MTTQPITDICAGNGGFLDEETDQAILNAVAALWTRAEQLAAAVQGG